jgi:dTDP-4-dehydrorhamnose 3,5-epimerase
MARWPSGFWFLVSGLVSRFRSLVSVIIRAALKVTETSLPGVLRIEPTVFGDSRGFFMETYHAERFREVGIDATFVQDNHSRSARGVVRGLHYQEPNPQGKLVRCTRGTLFDVAVDIRRGSPTFGKWYAEELSEENKLMLWVPPGFAHGFCAMTDVADLVYKCTALYDGASDRAILWNDPDVGIGWPDIGTPSLSAKDAAAPRLREVAILPSYR